MCCISAAQIRELIDMFGDATDGEIVKVHRYVCSCSTDSTGPGGPATPPKPGTPDLSACDKQLRDYFCSSTGQMVLRGMNTGMEVLKGILVVVPQFFDISGAADQVAASASTLLDRCQTGQAVTTADVQPLCDFVQSVRSKIAMVPTETLRNAANSAVDKVIPSTLQSLLISCCGRGIGTNGPTTVPSNVNPGGSAVPNLPPAVQSPPAGLPAGGGTKTANFTPNLTDAVKEAAFTPLGKLNPVQQQVVNPGTFVPIHLTGKKGA
jgi:hypothetical protein